MKFLGDHRKLQNQEGVAISLVMQEPWNELRVSVLRTSCLLFCTSEAPSQAHYHPVTEWPNLILSLLASRKVCLSKRPTSSLRFWCETKSKFIKSMSSSLQSHNLARERGKISTEHARSNFCGQVGCPWSLSVALSWSGNKGVFDPRGRGLPLRSLQEVQKFIKPSWSSYMQRQAVRTLWPRAKYCVVVPARPISEEEKR